MSCAQSQPVEQVVFARSTQACVQLCVQHEGIAAHTAETQGSGPVQSCAARFWQDASQLALPQQAGFCAQTAVVQGSWHEAVGSAAPVRQTECGHVAGGGHAPQSAAQEVQVSPLLQTPLPQQAPHIWFASFTHWPSQFIVQQNASAAHTCAAHASQLASSLSPVSQGA